MRYLIQRKLGVSWGCSECRWNFIPPKGPPIGDTIREMAQNYLQQRDKEFAGHKCSEHPK